MTFKVLSNSNQIKYSVLLSFITSSLPVPNIFTRPQTHPILHPGSHPFSASFTEHLYHVPLRFRLPNTPNYIKRLVVPHLPFQPHDEPSFPTDLHPHAFLSCVHESSLTSVWMHVRL